MTAPLNYTLVPLIRVNRDPLSTDRLYQSGAFWLNTTTETLFSLVGVTASAANWVLVRTKLDYTAGNGKIQYLTPGVFTFTVPLYITRIQIELWGAGGGGGSGQPNSNVNGAGGAAGGYCLKQYYVVPGANYTIVVGAGGAGGVNGASGLPGGTTSFSSLCSATGGAAGSSGAIGGGTTISTGGNGIGGDINFQGQSGVVGGKDDSIGTGDGGNAVKGAGGRGGTNKGESGKPGTTGAGGGGGRAPNGNGAAGGSGSAVITW